MRLLTLARDLSRRKSRERQSLFVAEGVRSVEELLRSGLTIKGVLTAPQLDGAQRGSALRASLDNAGVEVIQVSESEFRSAAETESPQGVLAIAAIPERSLDSIRGGTSLRLLVLDGIQDPGNVGTILRTAAALGADATVALPGTVDFWNPKVVRAAMGALYHHHALSSTSTQLFAFLADEKIPLWAADTHGKPVHDVPVPARVALAVGNEGAGLSSSVRELSAETVSLPIASSTESLNVAVATGILLYELRSR
ncbi:MAG TPA: RNA methyltransferase [Gemmatimonadaceae bacterium]|nr:RNA methyltransferase [Gemmatimonadaceae bacterium]